MATNPEEGYQKARDLYHQGRREQAESQLRRFLQRSSTHAGANNLMAILLIGQGRFDRALHHAQTAVKIEPRQVAYLNTLGVLLTHMKRAGEAVEVLRRAIEIFPAFSPAQMALGVALADMKDVSGAEACFRKAIELQPRDPQPRTNLAKLLLDLGRAAESAKELESALECAPEHRQVLSDLAGALNYIEADPQHVLSIHKRLGSVLERAAGKRHEHTAATGERGRAGRRLRIGYLSADFRAHSVAYFVEPLFKAHDRKRFEILCYHASPESDAVTKRLKSLADHWRDVAVLDDQRLAERVRQDRLDVLLDLGGHTSGSRTGVLAWRPAPVQVNWCGYANTTGVSSTDYRIVDALTDPASAADAMATEKLLRLPECFLCYQPPEESPEPSALPASGAGHVTFGSFNMLPKIGEACIAHWAQIMRGVADSRMVIKARGMELPGVRERVSAAFEQHGIGADRLDLMDMTPSLVEHLAMYNRIDVALDTWPYHGTTTTCEALWMGVPVVTRIGDVHASRVGLSLLSAAGLAEFACRSSEEAAKAAARLAGDLRSLGELRGSLRSRMRASVLCDASRFARRFEDALMQAIAASASGQQK